MTVKALALVSLLTDVASEMIYPLLPLFLSAGLGVSMAMLGVIEGAAEAVSSLLRIPVGMHSDRIRRRRPYVIAGYALASAVRPLVALAQSAGQVLAIRVVDRFGKGIRSAPRDALIADAVRAEDRGRAFGLHRGADHLGAVLGPLVAWALLASGTADVRGVFLWSAVPGALAVLAVLLLVRERTVAAPPRADPGGAAPHAGAIGGRMGPAYRRYLAVLFLFTLSTSTDAFLLLRASQLGVPTSLVPVLWALLHAVKSASSVVGGALSDRLGRRPMILSGWSLYAVVYAGFAMAGSAWHAWALFLVYGLHFGLSEGTEKALVADFAPAAHRGAAFGWYHAVVGLAALPASLLFGLVWDRRGAGAAFTMGAGIAMLAVLAFAFLVPPARTAPGAGGY